MYYIYLDGVRIEVSRDVYQDFYKYERKDRYFFKDLKFGRIRKDPKSGQEIYIPPQEVSWEEVSERERSMPDDEDVEEQAIQTVLKERLRKALNTLTEEELSLIYALYYECLSLSELSRRARIPRKTLRKSRDKILVKLKKLL